MSGPCDWASPRHTPSEKPRVKLVPTWPRPLVGQLHVSGNLKARTLVVAFLADLNADPGGYDNGRRCQPRAAFRCSEHGMAASLQTMETVESCVTVRKVPQAGHEPDLATPSVPARDSDRYHLGLGDGTAVNAAHRDTFGPEQLAQVRLPVPAQQRTAAAQTERGDAVLP